MEAPSVTVHSAAYADEPDTQVQTRPKLSTASPRLDDLLGGGYPGRVATLLYGPPFSGKEILQQTAFVAAACRGVPATFLLNGLSATAMSRRLNTLNMHFGAAEEAGVVTYVDMHSRVLGAPAEHPNAVYVEDPHDASELVAKLQGRPRLLAIQSASTLFMDLGTSRAVKFLDTVLEPVLQAGGVGLVCLQSGMHADIDVQMTKLLCGGIIELQKQGDVMRLQVHGLKTAVPQPGWIEYDFTPSSFRLKGEF